MPKLQYDNVNIFAVKCSLNDDVYITSSTGDLNRAFIRLKNKAKQGHQQHIFHHMRTHGLNNYCIELLETIEHCKNKSDIIASEAKYIKLLKPTLNLPEGFQIINKTNDISHYETINVSSSASEASNNDNLEAIPEVEMKNIETDNEYVIPDVDVKTEIVELNTIEK